MNKPPKNIERFAQALKLPKLCNLNPRSIYNKIDDFTALVEQEELDLVFISESWERQNISLKEVLNLPSNFEVISNVYQRQEAGGRPAIIANKAKYHVENLTNSLVQIPLGVEAVWCVLTPKILANNSKVRKIVCCSLYSKPGSKKKSLLLDHISETFSLLSTKYGKGVHFVISGDANRLKLDQILNLSPKLVQVVDQWTRLNPPAILDPIIMTLANYYQKPVCIEPLEVDVDKRGENSDHRIVICKPITTIENQSARTSKIVKFRPLSKQGLSSMQEWLVDYDWKAVYEAENADEKAEMFQKILVEKFNTLFPVKTRTINSDDQPWFSYKLKKLDRQRKRVYRREKRSPKWKRLDLLYKSELKDAKANFYKKEVSKLKNQHSGKWYETLKKLTSHDQHRSEEPYVEEIAHLPDQQQANLIADHFLSIPNQYDSLKSEDIHIPEFSPSEVPQFHLAEVWFALSRIKTNKATVEGDISAAIIQKFAAYLCEPFTHILNCSLMSGVYPRIYKYETCTPVPKVHPTKNLGQLRNISGLLTFDKVFEKLLAELLISDMEQKMDKSQFGNQKSISIQHYLIQMLQRILSAVDDHKEGSSYAVIANLIDWNNAFPRQCPKLGVESFIKNGVRPSLVPILISYFQDRMMRVKWHGCLSEPKHVKGGGPQGATLGLLEYLAQSNNSADCVPLKNRFKFIDDLSTLEIVNLLTVGLTMFNLKEQVPNDLPLENYFIPPEKLLSQTWLNEINDWTEKQKMKINEKKTKAMIFNFSKKFQFSSRLKLKGENIEFINETKLLGTIIQNDLKWNQNTRQLILKANARMELLRKVASFSTPIEDLKEVYILFVRSILEQSAVVWHSSLTEEESDNLERVQKTAIKIILKNNYKGYENGLQKLGLETLKDRRENLCRNFALKCTKNEKLKHMFPLNAKRHKMKTRRQEKFKVFKAKSERYKKSAIIHMQKLLNSA